MNVATFLIIDDSMVMRTILRYLLERCGEKVLAEGKDSEEAVALTRELNPGAIAIAASLRGEDGLAVLAAIRQTGWIGKAFFTVSGEQSAAEGAARQANVDGVLRKPFTLDQVRAEVGRVVAGGEQG